MAASQTVRSPEFAKRHLRYLHREAGQKRISDARDLAVMGAEPAFADTLHVGAPNVGSQQALFARIAAMLDRRRLTNDGPLVREFESRLAELTGARHCLAVASATAGLQILARATELTGEVIVPAFTFVATAHALHWLGLKPVFCDIDERTHNIDPAKAAASITPQTSAIVGVHVWGRPCAVEELQALAGRHGIALYMDAAHAFGCSHAGTMMGNFGRAEVFSFHATKILNTFEGGAIVTNDGALAQRIRLLRNFGFSGYDEVAASGTNGKMSEVAAAMGLTGLEALEEFVAANRDNYHAYVRELGSIPGVSLLHYDESERNNYQYVVIEIDEAAGLSRDEVVRILHAENVLARRYFHPGCHRMRPYADGAAPAHCPATDRVASRVVVLPTGTAVRPEQIRVIAQALRVAVAHAAELRSAMPEEPAEATGTRPAPETPNDLRWLQ